MDESQLKDCIGKAVQGDAAAFREIVLSHQRLVAHVVFRMTGNAADAEDLCQDVFVKVYQNLGGFRGESKFSTWVGRIAYNTCINHLHKKRMPLFEDVRKGSGDLDDQPGNDEWPDAYAEGRDLKARMDKEMACLTGLQRTVLTLYHVDEMSYGEIGEMLEMPEGTIKSHLFRARKKLR
ncbi:sigma-70 family RNA polymerase sigma factor, partial [bacterium]|nr:sigma-70 family RNA polymerase sigma factor [bacterium]